MWTVTSLAGVMSADDAPVNGSDNARKHNTKYIYRASYACRSFSPRDAKLTQHYAVVVCLCIVSKTARFELVYFAQFSLVLSYTVLEGHQIKVLQSET